VSLSVTARRGADLLGSRTLLRPGERERTGGLRCDVPGAWPPAEAWLAGWCQAGTLPPAPDHPGSPGIRSAADHPGDVLEFLQHRGVPAGAPRSSLRRDPRSALPWGATGPRAACTTDADISAMAIQEDPVGGRRVRSPHAATMHISACRSAR